MGQNNRENDYLCFSQVLKNSLSVEKTTPAFCETCKKFTPTNQYARVTELPQILSINCGLTNEKEMTFLRRQMNRNTTNGIEVPTIVQPNSSSTPIKPCRYGQNCSRVDCHFAHSDRKSPTTSTTNSSNTNGTAASTTTTTTSITATTTIAAAAAKTIATAANNGRSSTWFPLKFTMEIENDANNLKIDLNGFPDNNIIVSSSSDKSKDTEEDDTSNTITDAVDNLSLSADECEKNSDAEDTSMCSSSPTNVPVPATSTSKQKLYNLSAVVCQIINGTQKNLVALIFVGNRYHQMKIGEQNTISGQWYIFNDFR